MKKRILSLATAMAVILTMASCQKEQKENSAKGILFYASYNGDIQTKAPSVFTSGNKVTILGYSSGVDVTSSSAVSGTPLEATCGASGLLTPASALYLPKGSYDFYSVSLNSSTAPGLIFTSGQSAQLSNGIDYLWAKSTGISEGGTASFMYYHKAVGIEINIASGTGVSGLSVTSIKITPTIPTAASKMSLSNGIIGSANDVGVSTAMNLSGSKGTYIMLPINSTAINVELTVNATIGGTPVTAKKYTSTIPAQIYASGSYYIVNFTVSSSAMQFTGAQVQDWTTQSITGATLAEQ